MADIVPPTITAELSPSPSRAVAIRDIQAEVAEHFRVRLADMTSERRARAIARPRQVAMYLVRQLTQRSLPEIGRLFGGRDHTTVLHGIRKVQDLMRSDRVLEEDVRMLERRLSLR